MNRTVMSPTLYRNKKGEREECSCPSAAVCVRRGLEANPTPTDAEISITRKRKEERREKKLQGSLALMRFIIQESQLDSYCDNRLWLFAALEKKKSYLYVTNKTGESHLHLHPLLTFLHKEIEEPV
jgi:hypothetical protein